MLEIGLTILMLYRFLANDKTNKTIEYSLGVITAVFVIILTALTNSGAITYAQFFGAFGMLVGTYLLISVKQQLEYIEIRERFGWLLYGIGHFFTSYIGYQKHEWIFFMFQFLQMLLCFGGFAVKDLKKRRVAINTILILGTVTSLIFIIFISNIK